MPSAKDDVSTTETFTDIQHRIVDAQKQLATAIAGLVPEPPAWLSDFDVPTTPDPKKLVEQNFAFRTKVLEANKAFSLSLLDAWALATPQPAGATSTRAAAKS